MMDGLTLEKENSKKFVAMPRSWLHEAEQIERFIQRKNQYNPDFVKEDGSASPFDDNLKESIIRLNCNN